MIRPPPISTRTYHLFPYTALFRSPEPFDEPGIAGLCTHDIGRVERAGRDQHADQGKAHRDLVSHYLRGGAQRTQKRVLGVRRPAGDHDAVNTHRSEEHTSELQSLMRNSYAVFCLKKKKNKNKKRET